MERRLTAHDMPQYNGLALNRRLLERVRTILHHSRLPQTLWGGAIHPASWPKNWSSTRILGDITPYQRLHPEKPNLAGLSESGQHVWVHRITGTKFDARGSEGRWVGFDKASTHTQRVYWPGKNSVSVERNIKFTPMVLPIS